jgi:hypothetical protein
MQQDEIDFRLLGISAACDLQAGYNDEFIGKLVFKSLEELRLRMTGVTICDKIREAARHGLVLLWKGVRASRDTNGRVLL